MTKSELIKTVAKQASLTEAQTNEAVKALTDVITAALAKGEKAVSYTHLRAHET